jgi:membrane protease subunit (stomatin/prohibitin family)
MCGGGGSVLGAVVGAALAYATGGASLGLTAAEAAVAGGVAGAAAGDQMVDQPAKKQQEALELQKQANAGALQAAQAQADQAQQVFNKANSKSPDVGAMLSANANAAKAGNTSTMLTGNKGVDAQALNLGKNTLLGA